MCLTARKTPLLQRRDPNSCPQGPTQPWVNRWVKTVTERELLLLAQRLWLGPSGVHGWGGFVKEPIKKHQFIHEYVGEVR